MNASGDISVHIAPDLTEVRVHAPKGVDAHMVTAPALAKRLIQLGIEVNDQVMTRLEAFSKVVGADGAEHSAIVAMATKPALGAPGHVDWAVGLDPGRIADAAASAGNAQKDHYTGRKYPRITAGTKLGVVVPPGEGTAGRDVRGGVIDAKGPAVLTRLDASIACDAAGVLTAKRDGMLVLLHGRYQIADSLDIEGAVDFTTGHIEADGDVAVHGSVLTGFKVTAKGNLKVQGLVEAAELSCDGDLTLSTGMAGGDRGAIHIRGGARVGYLDGVHGTVEGGLVVDREIVNCTLVIGGSLEGRDATLFGGEVAVTGACMLKVLGSEAHRPTVLCLGDVPLLSRLSAETVRAIKVLDAKLARLAEAERIIRINPRLKPAEREKLTEMAFEIQDLTADRASKLDDTARIQDAVQKKRRLEVEISKAILPNVRLVIGAFTVQFTRLVRGPVRIFWDPAGHLMSRIGSAEACPLETIAHVVRTPAAATTKSAA